MPRKYSELYYYSLIKEKTLQNLSSRYNKIGVFEMWISIFLSRNIYLETVQYVRDGIPPRV